jgi:hypothetical protein
MPFSMQTKDESGSSVRTADLRASVNTDQKTSVSYFNVSVRGYGFTTLKGSAGISFKVSKADLEEMMVSMTDEGHDVACFAAYAGNQQTAAPPAVQYVVAAASPQQVMTAVAPPAVAGLTPAPSVPLFTA